MVTGSPEQPTANTRPVPELDASTVEGWRASGGPLIDLLAVARERHGGVVAVRVGPEPTVLVTDPGAAQHVLALRPDRYVKRSHRARMLVGDGVLSATGDAWRRQRRLLQSQFTGPGMRRYEARIAAAAAATAERWAEFARDGREFDLGDEMRRFALDTIWRSLTGHPLDDRTNRELASINTVVAAMPSLPADSDDARRAVAGELERIDAIALHAIAAARLDGDGPDGPGLLGVLLAAGGSHGEGHGTMHADGRDDGPAGYSDRLVRDELVTLTVAGHETTASTLTWLYLLLDRHPEAREAALAAGPAGSPERTAAVQALVSETLRLYPSAWVLPRHAGEADTLAGHRIEAGTDLLVCPYLTHRDPELWPDPERFDPTRFTAPDRRPAEQGGYLPFGLGARACLGKQFALRESTVLLERLLPAHVPVFRSTPAGAAYSITVRPDGPTPVRLMPA